MISTQTTRIVYNGDAVTDTFAIPFRFDAEAHIYVYVGAVLKTNGTHYNIADADVGLDAGGSVVFTVGNIPPVGTGNIVIMRVTPAEQLVDLPSAGAFPSLVIERQALDKLMMLIQEIRTTLGTAVAGDMIKWDALARVLQSATAEDLDYTPEDPNDWIAQPVNVGDALDKLANLSVLAEADSADDLAYGVATPGDWPITVPDDVGEALDLLAARTAEDIPYTPATPADWAAPPDDVAEGLDKLASTVITSSVFPNFAVIAPVNGDFAWINQGSATVTVTPNGIVLADPANSTAVSLKVRKKAAPATPYTITTLIVPRAGIYADFAHFGILFRESSSGKMHSFSIQYNSGLTIRSDKWTDATNYSATYTSNTLPTGQFIVWPMLFMRIADNGTNRILSISNDGSNWFDFHTIGRTDFLTADEVGFYVDARNATHAGLILLRSWTQA